MPTTTILNSSNAKVYLGTAPGTAIALSTDAQLNTTMDPRDVTNKDSGGWRQLLEGLRSWSMSASFFVLTGTSWGWKDYYAAWVARAELDILFTAGLATGDFYYSGKAFATSGNLSSPNAEDSVVSDVNFEGSGALSETART